MPLEHRPDRQTFPTSDETPELVVHASPGYRLFIERKIGGRIDGGPWVLDLAGFFVHATEHMGLEREGDR